MKEIVQRTALLTALAIVALIAPGGARADEQDGLPWRNKPRLIFHPAGPGEGRARFAVGGIYQVAPQVTANFRYGLPLGFSVDARAMVVLVRNELDLGAAWAARVGPFDIGLLFHAGGWFGGIGNASELLSTQFKSRGWGAMLNPGAFAGLQVASDAWLTFQFESYIAPYQAVSLGGFVITPTHASVFNGFAFTTTVECPVGRGILYYGLGLYHTTSNYPLWINVEYSATMITYGSAFAGYEF